MSPASQAHSLQSETPGNPIEKVNVCFKYLKGCHSLCDLKNISKAQIKIPGRQILFFSHVINQSVLSIRYPKIRELPRGRVSTTLLKAVNTQLNKILMST